MAPALEKHPAELMAPGWGVEEGICLASLASAAPARTSALAMSDDVDRMVGYVRVGSLGEKKNGKERTE